jgi:exopolysaccharide biosynthesis polyprenyl glycosylphosphotransferase
MSAAAAAREALARSLGSETVLGEATLSLLEHRRRTARRRGWLVRRALLAADAIGLLAAFLAARQLAASPAGGTFGVWAEVALLLGVTLPAWVIGAKLIGLYDRDEERASHSTTDDLAGVFQLCTLGAWLFLAGTWATDARQVDFGRLLVFWVLAVALVTGARVGARAVCRRRLTYMQNTVVVGAGDVGQLVARKLLQHPEYGINLLGFVDGDPRPLGRHVVDVPVLGGIDELPALVRVLDVERVIVAFTRDSRERMVDLVRTLQDLDVQIDVVPRFFEVVGASADVHSVEGLALVGLRPIRLPRSSRLLKRTLDLSVAALALVLLAPLLAAISLAVKLDSRGPVFFRQERRGAGDRTFSIVKFRTMADGADGRKADLVRANDHARAGGDVRMFKMRRDPRVTRVGRLLRRLSLDELPQLWNVVRGEMSLVGPRPLVLSEDRHVATWARRRVDLLPGMTGLWQVLGRSEIPFEEMVRLDYLYVTSWSLAGDVKLLLRTIPALLTGAKGAY